jgi:thiol-disulfide isomerase/thioredoxin
MKVILVILALSAASLSFGQAEKRKKLERIPAITVLNQAGERIGLDSLAKGKVTFIDFWFIPCGPCFAEMNMLHQIHAKYKGNPNVNFMTITFSDSSFVRALTENRTTDSNDVYLYFKKLSHLDTFRLPVYFSTPYTIKIKKFKYDNETTGFVGSSSPTPIDFTQSPDAIFGFQGYPTVMIFNKTGRLIYNETGYNKRFETQKLRQIQRSLDSALE